MPCLQTLPPFRIAVMNLRPKYNVAYWTFSTKYHMSISSHHILTLTYQLPHKNLLLLMVSVWADGSFIYTVLWTVCLVVFLRALRDHGSLDWGQSKIQVYPARVYIHFLSLFFLQNVPCPTNQKTNGPVYFVNY